MAPLSELCVQGEIIPIIESIEVTEFVEDQNPETDNIDINSVNQNIATDADSANFESVIDEELPFQILDKQLNQLNDIKRTLSRRRGYHPILHISWRQPVQPKRKSTLIRLYAGKNYSDTFNLSGDSRVDIVSLNAEPTEEFEAIVQDQQFNMVPAENDIDTDFSTYNSEFIAVQDPLLIVKENLDKCQILYQDQAEQEDTDVWQLDGNMLIYVERYLHVETDLSLRIPGKEELELGSIETSLAAEKLLNTLQINETNNNKNTGFGWQLSDDFLRDDASQTSIVQDVLNKFIMQQTRRLRSNELHYIDHPLFGLIIQIRPYEKLVAKDAITQITD